MFIYSMLSVNRNIVRYNKYIIVVTVVVVFVSVIVIVIVIVLEILQLLLVIGVLKFKFEYPIYSVFRKKFNRTRSVPL